MGSNQGEMVIDLLRLILMVFVIAALSASAPAAADDGPVSCEPVVVGVTWDETTTPPTPQPYVWINEECIDL